MNMETIKIEEYHPPYTLDIPAAAKYFGLAKQTLYNKICTGELKLFVHYLKYGKKILIIREAFIQYLFQCSGRQNYVSSGR